MGVVVNNSFSEEKLKKFLNKADTSLTENQNRAYRHLVKADALRIRNYFWESIEEYLISLKYDDKNPDTYTGLGYSYKQAGCVKNAMDAFNNAKKLSPFQKELYFETGCCYCIDYEFGLAIKEYQRALKLCPDFLEARFNLAYTYEMDNRNSLAIKEYKKIIEENPGHSKSYNNLASLYMKLDSYKKAIETFKRLLKFDSEYVRAYLGIAISFDKLKDKASALRYYKKYLKYKPDSNNLAYILDRIGELSIDRKAVKKSHLKLVS